MMEYIRKLVIEDCRRRNFDTWSGIVGFFEDVKKRTVFSEEKELSSKCVAQQTILDCVYPGIKAGQLVTDVMASLRESGDNFDYEIPKLLDQMVESGKIVELEYVLRDSDYRIRSLYFPANTEFLPK